VAVNERERAYNASQLGWLPSPRSWRRAGGEVMRAEHDPAQPTCWGLSPICAACGEQRRPRPPAVVVSVRGLTPSTHRRGLSPICGVRGADRGLTPSIARRQPQHRMDDQLKNFERGDLNAGKTAITVGTLNFAQESGWGLSPTLRQPGLGGRHCAASGSGSHAPPPRPAAKTEVNVRGHVTRRDKWTCPLICPLWASLDLPEHAGRPQHAQASTSAKDAIRRTLTMDMRGREASGRCLPTRWKRLALLLRARPIVPGQNTHSANCAAFLAFPASCQPFRSWAY
jgi:hypothetical protein